MQLQSTSTVHNGPHPSDSEAETPGRLSQICLFVRKNQRTELTSVKGNSLTEDTPRARDAVTNALRLHSHNFAYKTFKIKGLKLKRLSF